MTRRNDRLNPCPGMCLAAALAGMLLAHSLPAAAALYLDGAQTLRLFGDLRGRFEADFDSRDEAGSPRDDRDRLRYRLRLGLAYEPDDFWQLQFRARTTREASQQSSALTIRDLSGGSRDDFRLFPDQWFARYRNGSREFWIGRNTYPFWQANPQEMIWADNATLMGAYGAIGTSGRALELGLRGGYFGLPDGMFDAGGRLGAAQATFELTAAETRRLRAAAGMLAIDGTDSTRFLIDGNGRRDYRIGMVSGEIRKRLDANPAFVSLGVDLLHNFRHYSANDPDPVSAGFRNERSGLVLSLLTGSPVGQGRGERWEFGYVYAYIEKLALNAAYAQSDWVRWGSGGQTRSSDLRGHGLSGRYWFTDNLDLRARLYLVDAIATAQDGNRFRIDLNYRF